MDLNDSQTKRDRMYFQYWLTSIAGAIFGGIIVLFAGWYFGFLNIDSPVVNAKAEITSINKQTEAVGLRENMIDVIENVSPAVVGIVNIQQRSSFYNGNLQEVETGTGSGVIFKKSGDDAFIITNNHVIEGAKKVEVSLDNGKKVNAEIVGADPLSDLAVLKIISKNVEVVASLGDSSALQIGEQVVAIGNPLGLQFSRTATQGIISGLQRTVPVTTSQGEWDLNVIQTDAAINPGNSGGALVNSAGKVIGINSLKIAQSGVEGIGFAIPSNDVIPIVEDLMNYGKVKRPYIGVALMNLSDIPQYTRLEELNVPSDMTEGVVITSVEPFSAGAKAGLQPKDVIVAINGSKIHTVSDLRKYLYSNIKTGDQAEFEIYRGNEKMKVTVSFIEKE